MIPSKSRLMLRRKRPQVLLPETPSLFEVFLLLVGWCRVKSATPDVTSATTAYLCNGYFLRKTPTCSAMTGTSLQDFARMKVMYPTCFREA